MTRQVRWLHLSDIHFRAKSKLDQNDAFIRVRADLAKRKTEGRCPDLIFITGDITHSGRAADFDDVSKLIAALCDDCALPHKRAFFCPGNHDSDIDKAAVLVRGCWSSFSDVAALPSFLEGTEYLALKERQAAYRSFVKTFRGDSGGFDAHELHAVNQISLGDLNIGVLSINSALLAEGGPEDHGRLQVCVRKLEERCMTIRENHLVFALIHHPFEWLAAFEADRAEGLVFNSADILLRGHLHQPKLAASQRGIVSAVGAVWEKTAGDYEYSFGSLSLTNLKCEIESVRYVQQTGKWMHSSEEATLLRSRDERSTPRVVRAGLGATLKFPAQIAAVLAGYTNELMMTAAGGSNYFSTERILAQAVKSGDAGLPALAVVRVATLLTFYGFPSISSILEAELESLSEYDQALQAAEKDDPDFAEAARAREVAANRFADLILSQPQPWSSRLLARLASEGEGAQITAMRNDIGGLLGKLKAALSGGARDPYEAWLAAHGPDLDYSELETVATRLAVKGTADLASLALSDAATRFPNESRKLDSVARIIATELADPNIYTKFKTAVGAS